MTYCRLSRRFMIGEIGAGDIDAGELDEEGEAPGLCK